ncbi:hypothetical protein CRUP_037049, partial [Coryphaenoides rupestris]
MSQHHTAMAPPGTRPCRRYRSQVLHDQRRSRTRVNIGPAAFVRWSRLKECRRLKSHAEVATFLLDRKHAKRRKTAEEKKEEKKAARKRRQESCKTRIYIGGAFDRWKSLKVLKGLRSDMQLAVLLLDCYEKWCALVSNIPEGSITDCCKVEKHPDDSIYVGKRKRELPCDQEIQANPVMDGDLHLKGGSEITSNMSEEGCTGITFDISEITFAPDQDSNCSNEEAG